MWRAATQRLVPRAKRSTEVPHASRLAAHRPPPDEALGRPRVRHLEDGRQYHQYEVPRDVGNLRGAYDSLDGDHKELIDAFLQGRGKTADDLETLETYPGELAAVDRFGSPGGAVRVQLALPVEFLQVLGILRELP
jgi:hypothetical protein